MKIRATGLSSSTKMLDIINESLLGENDSNLQGVLQQAGVSVSADAILGDLKERISEEAEETHGQGMFGSTDYEESTDFKPDVESELGGVFYRFHGKGTVNWNQGMKSHDYGIPDDPDEVESWNVSGVLEIYVDDESIGQVNLNLSK